MLEFISSYPGIFLWVLTGSAGMALVLLVASIAFGLNLRDTKKLLLEREAEIVIANESITLLESRANSVKVRAEIAEERLNTTQHSLARKAAEYSRADAYIEGLIGGVHLAREKCVGTRDFRPFVEQLVVWAMTEESKENNHGRDRFVRHALRIACEERMVCPDLLVKLPPSSIELTVRRTLADLQAFGTQGNQIIMHALSLGAGPENK